jgi:hypothetical protein
MVRGRFRLFCDGGNAPATSQPKGTVFRAVGAMLIEFPHKFLVPFRFATRSIMRLW